MVSYSQAVKYIHMAMVVPLLLFVGCKGLDNKSVPKYVYVGMMVLATAALLHHSGMLRLNKLLNVEHFEPKVHTVDIVNYKYRPQHMHVRLGDTVEWINRDSSMHTATSMTNQFNSKEMQQDEGYRFTFTRPGVYNYYSTPHPYMKGAISVVMN